MSDKEQNNDEQVPTAEPNEDSSEDTVGEAERRRNLPYSTWIREGLVIPTPGARLDHEAVARDIVAFGQTHRILGIASDPWNVGPLATFLQKEGFAVTSVPQNTRTLNVPSKMLEGLVVERKLRHAGHAVLAFNANNVSVYSDATGCIKPEKKGKDEKIDGIAALVNAMALASTASNDAESWDLVEL
jgi:phage terminase large subunit-like protein